MNTMIWIKRILQGLFLLGTIAAAALWIAVMNAKCEGFGCLGVGAIAGMAFIVQLICAIVGGVLIWLKRKDDKLPKWLIILEGLHLLPVLWFAGRMALG